MASQKDFKAPPSLNKVITYSNWKKELRIWEAFTNFNNEKKGPAIFLTLNVQAREAALEIPVEELTAETNLNKLLEVLDELYLKDEVSLAYEAYEAFEKFVRPASMTINDYVIHFERLHNKAKGYKMEIHDGVLAYRLLNNSNIAESHKPLIRATLPDDLRYTTMWKQLKECSLKQSPQNQLKLSNQKQNFQSNLSDDSSGREDVYFSDKRSSFQKREDNSGNGTNRYRGKLNNQGFQGRGNNIRSGNNRYRGGNNNYNKNLPKTNPLDSKGEVSKCLVCGSVYHCAKDRPYSFEARTKQGTFHKF